MLPAQSAQSTPARDLTPLAGRYHAATPGTNELVPALPAENQARHAAHGEKKVGCTQSSASGLAIKGGVHRAVLLSPVSSSLLSKSSDGEAPPAPVGFVHMFTRGTSAIMGDVHPREKLVPPKAERAKSTTGKKDAASSDMPVDSKPKRGTAQKDNRDKKREPAFAIMGDNGNRCPSASGGEVLVGLVR